jgi:hypothetical protein
MRANLVLVPKGWYWVLTDVNNREAVLRLPRAVRLLREVLCRARGIYEFEGRGLRVEGYRVSFYINAADGFAAILLNRGQPSQKNVPILKNLKKITFFAGFLCRIKAYPLANSLVQWGKVFSQKHGEEVCV